MSRLAEYRKALAAVVGIAGAALGAGLIPSPESSWITAIIALLGAMGVYALPNRKPPKTVLPNNRPQYKA